jgi:hypothetical protein
MFTPVESSLTLFLDSALLALSVICFFPPDFHDGASAAINRRFSLFPHDGLLEAVFAPLNRPAFQPYPLRALDAISTWSRRYFDAVLCVLHPGHLARLGFHLCECLAHWDAPDLPLNTETPLALPASNDHGITTLPSASIGKILRMING